MSRLIDADDFKVDVDERGFDFFVSKTDLDNVQKMIDEQKTVDAVPVVRCKDCANRLAFPDGVRLCFGGICSGATHDDFFCANGIRKEKTDG